MSFTKKVVAGQDISSADFRQYFGDFFSSFVKTGFEVTDDTGLDVSVSAGTAYVKDATDGMYQVTSDAAESMTMENNTTNYIFLHSDNGANYLTSSTTATVPDDAILIGTVVTAAGDVSSVADNRITSPQVTTNAIFTHYTGTDIYAAVAGNGTVQTLYYYFYFNPSADKIISFDTLKFEFDRSNANATVAVHVNMGGGEEEKYTASTSEGTKTVTLNVSNSSYTSYDCYIKFSLYCGSGVASAVTAYVKDIRMNYTIS